MGQPAGAGARPRLGSTRQRWVFGLAVVALLVGSAAVVVIVGQHSDSPAPTRPEPWSTSFEEGDLSGWNENAGISEPTQNSGDATTAVTSELARTGKYSMKQTIDTTDGTSGARQTRYTEASQIGREFAYSAWYFLPQAVTPTDGHWNVMQFKAKEPDDETGSHPFWTLEFVGDPLRLVLNWKGGFDAKHDPVPGPFADSPVREKEWTQTKVLVPIGRWFKVEARLRMTADFTGSLQVHQDGVRLFRLENIRSTFSADSRSSWTVNNYSNGLSVNPYSLYVDDASIRPIDRS